PFTAAIQIRFKKPADTARTRLETRTLDPKLDRLAFRRRRLAVCRSLHEKLYYSSRKRGRFISLNLLPRWAPLVGLKTIAGGKFVQKYPHVFEVFTHPLKRNLCCRFTKKFTDLVDLEDEAHSEMEEANVMKIGKILAMSLHGRVHVHAIRLIRTELGLPRSFVETLIRNRERVFSMANPEIVELVNWEEEEEEVNQRFTAQVEKWREKEYREKWLSEYDTKYAFPVNFPTGFRMGPGFREKLKNWQRLPYIKPYQRTLTPSSSSSSSGGEIESWNLKIAGIERYQKRAVGIIHELLHLTVEKMIDLDRLSHFRKDLGIEINIREVLLKHQGIFYISTRGNRPVVFLREAYDKGILTHSDEIEIIRRKMLELLLLGRRFTRRLKGDSDGGTSYKNGTD
ncbi:hypothetical protein M569_09968, partial [Genlisea aurea]